MAQQNPLEAILRRAAELPVMMPAKVVGRDITLGQIFIQLRANKAALVYGTSGIGKTAVAAALASGFAELPGGVLWLRSENAPLAELIARVGRALQMPEIANSEAPATLIDVAVRTLRERRPLIVLDGALNAQAVGELANRLTGAVPMLLTNDDSLSGSWTALQLGRLDPTGAAALLQQRLPDMINGDALALAAELDYTPLALVIAAGAISAGQTLEDVMRALPPASAAASPTLRALGAAFPKLPGALQGLLLVIAAAPGSGGTLDLLAALANAPASALAPAVDQLVARGLIERYTRGGVTLYRLHAAVRDFAVTLLTLRKQLEALQTRTRDAVIAFATTHGTGSANDQDALALALDPLLIAAEQGGRAAAEPIAAAVMDASGFVSGRGYVYEFLRLRGLAAGSTTAFPANIAPPAPIVEAENDEDEFDSEIIDVLPAPEEDELVGAAAEDEDDVSADDLDEEIGYSLLDVIDTDGLEESDELEPLLLVPEDDDEEADDDDDFEPLLLVPEDEDDETLEEVGIGAPVFNFDAVDDEFRAVPPASFADEVEDEDEDADPLTGIAASAEPTDELERARLDLMRARQANDSRRKAELLVQIGRLQGERKHETEAIASYSEALGLYENLNDSFGMLETLEALAVLTARTENSQAAVLNATRGIGLAKAVGDSAALGRLNTVLGDARQQLGESDEAIRVYTQALELDPAPRDRAMLFFKLGYAQLDGGEPETALKTWTQAQTLFQQQARRDYEGRVLGGMGTANSELGRWSEASKLHNAALYIAREVSDKREEALQLVNLGYAAVQANQLGEAVLRYRQALYLAYQNDDKPEIVSISLDLARLLVESPRHLNVAALLIDAALEIEPNDRDLKRLSERIEDEREAVSEGVQRIPVNGTARDYAQNAYQLLEN